MSDVNEDLWKKNWDEGHTPWHLSAVHPALLEYSSRIQKGEDKRVFVPLCGKALELKWFYEAGYSVVGVELCESPASQFFKENDIPHEVCTSPSGPIYKSKDKRLAIYVGDLFEVDKKELGKFDVIWDRGSITAIEPTKQESYIELMNGLSSSNVTYLLETIYHELGIKFPQPLSRDDTQKLFGTHFEIEFLKSFTDKEFKGNSSFEFKGAIFNVFLLTKTN